MFIVLENTWLCYNRSAEMKRLTRKVRLHVFAVKTQFDDRQKSSEYKHDKCGISPSVLDSMSAAMFGLRYIPDTLA